MPAVQQNVFVIMVLLLHLRNILMNVLMISLGQYVVMSRMINRARTKHKTNSNTCLWNYDSLEGFCGVFFLNDMKKEPD